ncbi:hypothetical protein Caka_0327 [Coraliomargarita akajimensis DSM 45221]|uniref:Uncharacterized protein n=1 Tax=Coraliomargarita akajimensis (strain DSM 45221 / IAM 15411 / JCM 23193 / KCTC 12865 / 04OKA010-24) TaxID=583355 RepID=D5EME6_CORAD|nr:hypothetical protein Caka_0327 [Coraliomargarita akajimensis DSM 45221]
MGTVISYGKKRICGWTKTELERPSENGMKKESIIAPSSWYAAFNFPLGILYGIILPVSVGIYLDWSIWIVVPFTALWFIANGRIIDRYIPVLTTPVIHKLYSVTHPTLRTSRSDQRR